ncbi:ABC transporter, ATP-binding protein [Lapidilactobacillus dextrinicus DSM 20335]|uniref:ABC transporter, ATP-binding protein n=1 Tax=Lapidilactobacillus dextrinicus DSM 20335 TaxID=1423738 RepID=A0A0R2BJL6_9LACO|nr:ABC-F type ribosomal protection protein [Lapidilactobacillus dextrinicus]KRM79045.1 ABC transporter, ATP-binding protein [Lapidilactobacillus dextrinicus DSM 20335]QFG46069.1 ABC-F type ribosomal protection protein [Lapidilactobacillus dextrinicus]
MSNIEIKNLTFGYDSQGTLLFDQANLNIDSSWKLGLIGRNGRGKTTLMRLLQEQLPYQGQITKQLDFTYFPQTIANPDQLMFYAIQEISDAEQWEIERELNLLGVDPDILWRQFASLSGGEQTKVLLALLFINETDFPLIDEPTNHLDMTGRQQVADYLNKKQQGFIVVSHDRHFVDSVTDHIMSIEKSQILLYQGNFATYEVQKKLNDDFEQQQNAKLKKNISRLQQSAAKKASWSNSREADKHHQRTAHVGNEQRSVDKGFIGSRAAKMMKRSKNIAQRMNNEIADQEKLLKDIEYIDPLTMAFQPVHYQNPLIIKEVQLGYDEQWLFKPLSFDLKVHQRLAITGPNGAGKSSLIQAILQQFTGNQRGSITYPKQLPISYVRQNYENNRGSLAEFAEKNQLNMQDFLNNLHKLGMERRVFNNKIENMSMGQRKKVELAKSLSQPAALYIWDEPLNYLDVFNQEQLENLIQEVQPTMLIIEHDCDFIDKVATNQLKLETVD